VDGLRAEDRGAPDATVFRAEHRAYVAALEAAGVAVTVLEPLEAFPDSVFVEDPALILNGVAIVLRPGAPSRAGEAAALRPALEAHCDGLLDLEAGLVDGGDILCTDDCVMVGLSARTDREGRGVDAFGGAVGLPAGAGRDTARDPAFQDRVRASGPARPCSPRRVWPRRDASGRCG
jgi:hypothetical protein